MVIRTGPLPLLTRSQDRGHAGLVSLVDRTHYVIPSNTKSLYSTAIYGKGITDDGRFIERALSRLREFMGRDGQGFVYGDFIAPVSATVHLAGTLDRTVTGSVNDLINHATDMLAEGELLIDGVGFKLNDVLLSALARSKARKSGKPREAFKGLCEVDTCYSPG